ncbi:MAG: antibiotic biosynthesis monooxygenase [Gammaproteobacteria bacterium]|nr:antibiotic biosynthesis monooxygenase [Gammaproteobacteria bacterium]
MIIFIAKLVVKEGKELEFEQLQSELSDLTHANEPGVLVYDVIRHQEKARNYIVYARFKDQAAFDNHQTIDFHERLVPPILDCLAEEMDLQFYEHVA